MIHELSPSELNKLTQQSIELGLKAQEAAKKMPKAYLFTQSGINDDINVAVKEELNKRGIPYQEIDLTGQKLDDEWPIFPILAADIGVVGSFKSKETIEAFVSLIR